jgi:hypothetical protein
METKEFKKKAIFFDQLAYARAINDTNFKKCMLEDAYKWCGKYVNQESINKKKFMDNMSSEFLRVLKIENSKKIQLEINIYKLANLLDIPLKELNDYERKYDEINREIKLIGGLWKAIVKKEDYTSYTKNEVENEKLKIALELREIIKKVEKYRQLRPAFVVNALSSFIRYDMRDQNYYLNTNDRGI